jgi:hypothetical protein
VTAAERAARERREQGLPPHIEDEDVLAKIVALLAEAEGDDPTSKPDHLEGA